MSEAGTKIAEETRVISLELTSLAKATIAAVQKNDVAAIYEVILRRKALIKRLHELAKISPQDLQQSAELAEAAKVEQQTLGVLQERHASLAAELDNIEQQAQLKQAYK